MCYIGSAVSCGKYENINIIIIIVTQDPVKLHSQSSPGDLAVVEGQRNGKFSQNGKLGHS